MLNQQRYFAVMIILYIDYCLQETVFYQIIVNTIPIYLFTVLIVCKYSL